MHVKLYVNIKYFDNIDKLTKNNVLHISSITKPDIWTTMITDEMIKLIFL